MLLQVAGSVGIYCLAAAAVPIYNKLIFVHGVGGRRFAYLQLPQPMAELCGQECVPNHLQVYCTALFSYACNRAEVAVSLATNLCECRYPLALAMLQLSFVAAVLSVASVVAHACGREGSWICGPHFAYKVRNIAPIGVLSR